MVQKGVLQAHTLREFSIQFTPDQQMREWRNEDERIRVRAVLTDGEAKCSKKVPLDKYNIYIYISIHTQKSSQHERFPHFPYQLVLLLDFFQRKAMKGKMTP